jgi:hypothetical protein
MLERQLATFYKNVCTKIHFESLQTKLKKCNVCEHGSLLCLAETIQYFMRHTSKEAYSCCKLWRLQPKETSERMSKKLVHCIFGNECCFTSKLTKCFFAQNMCNMCVKKYTCTMFEQKKLSLIVSRKCVEHCKSKNTVKNFQSVTKNSILHHMTRPGSILRGVQIYLRQK